MNDIPTIFAANCSNWTLNVPQWTLWRTTYGGGEAFRDQYLKQYSLREEAVDFEFRRSVTPIPTFAKSAIRDIRNSIYQRMRDVLRMGGSELYQAAVSGQRGGVDHCGMGINSFLGVKVLTELLIMGKVGVFVDNRSDVGQTMADRGAAPYVYMYPVENILSYTRGDTDNPLDFTALLLRDDVESYDTETGLPTGTKSRFRRFWVGKDGLVRLQCYDSESNTVDMQGNASIGVQVLPLKKIPFILLDIEDSLLRDVAYYQIALLNLTSSDVTYAIRSNFPIPIRQADKRGTGSHQRQVDTNGSAVAGGQGSNDLDTRAGTSHGIIYDRETNPPAFIHPSSEPLKISMELQDRLEATVRKLVNLAVETLATRASAESKQLDNQGLESGLSYIGLLLEQAERLIGLYWADYEGNKNYPTVKYPDQYSLKTDTDRIDEAGKQVTLMNSLPGQTVKKEIAKNVVTSLFSGRLSAAKLALIYDEIDQAPYTTSDPVTIQMAVEKGLTSNDTASRALGFKAGEAKLAETDHAARLARIAASQGINDPGARGVADLSINPVAGATEKGVSKEPDLQGDATAKVRGAK